MPPRGPLRIDIDRKAMARVKSCAALLNPSIADLRSLALPVLGKVHRRQQAAIFASQGAKGASGPWRKLSPGYAARKKKVAPRAKILVLTTEMRNRFLKPGSKHYVQELQFRGANSWAIVFGARSRKAFRHFTGGKNLPQRDMVTKTTSQVSELRRRFVTWWTLEWLPRFQGACSQKLRLGGGFRL